MVAAARSAGGIFGSHGAPADLEQLLRLVRMGGKISLLLAIELGGNLRLLRIRLTAQAAQEPEFDHPRRVAMRVLVQSLAQRGPPRRIARR